MNARHASRALLILSFVAFVSLGLPDAVLGVAWPSIRHEFSIPISKLGALLLTGMIGYLSSSFLGGWLSNRLGVGVLLLLSSATITAALIGYATALAWGVVVGIGLLSGLGAGAIDSGINAYAAKHFSPRVVNWLHACWGIGATAGPTLMTFILDSGRSWRIGYATLASVLAFMTVGFALTVKMWRDTDAAPVAATDATEPPASIGAALARPIVWAQIALFFLYTGVETTIGQLAFSLLTESRGVSIRAAGLAVSSYWAGLTLGRILFGFLASSVPAALLLRIALLASPVCAVGLWMGGAGPIAFAGITLLGVAIAPIYPLMISLTPDRVGKPFAAHAIGFQVSAASLGASATPGLAGLLAARFGLETLPPFVFICALSILVMFEITHRASTPLPSPPMPESGIV